MAKRMTASQKAGLPKRILIRKNDEVQVIAGRDRGKRGRVLHVDRSTGKVLVEHVNMVKRHTRANPARQIKGGIAERESPISVSNVMLVCPACGPVRIAHKVDTTAGKPRWVRVCRKCGAPLEKK
ncbi:MAG: 50S ribosomal protein L24 [Bryobacteraceae bacterium]